MLGSEKTELSLNFESAEGLREERRVMDDGLH